MNEKLKIYLSFLLQVIGGLVIGYILIFTIHPFFVSGFSMEPTYHNGQIVLCSTDTSNLTYQDVVIVSVDKTLIKRIVGMPGDVIELKDGHLYRNGIIIEYYNGVSYLGSTDYPYTVPANSYFCMGDNFNDSLDSRDYGAFSINNIKYLVK